MTWYAAGSRRIRASGQLEHSPLIIMDSAFGREEIMRQAEAVGISAFLSKPINPELLMDAILNRLARPWRVLLKNRQADRHNSILAPALKAPESCWSRITK